MSSFASDLYVELAGSWELLWCERTDSSLLCYDKVDNEVGDVVLELPLNGTDFSAKATTMSMAALSKLLRSAKKLPESPYFFTLTISGHAYKFACAKEDERSKWIRCLKPGGSPREAPNYDSQYRKAGSAAVSGENAMLASNSTKQLGKQLSKQSLAPMSIEPSTSVSANSRSQTTQTRSPQGKQLNQEDTADLDDRDDDNNHRSPTATTAAAMKRRQGSTIDADDKSEEDPTENKPSNPNYITLALPFNRSITIPKFIYRLLKQETLARLFKVVTAFPFVIVVSSVNSQTQSNSCLSKLLTSVNVIRLMNLLIYVLPVLLVKFVLSQFAGTDTVTTTLLTTNTTNTTAAADVTDTSGAVGTGSAVHDRLVYVFTIGLYLFLYLLPVGFVVSKKLSVSSATNKIEDGTFCFKPARSVRCTQSNFYAMVGFIFEWTQHTLYVIPLGVISSSTSQTLISDYPPFIPFKVYFWMSVASSFLCGLIIVLNAVLKGKVHYKFQRMGIVWYILYNIGSPMYVTIVTILFMGLSCQQTTDTYTDPDTHITYTHSYPTLVQDPSLQCYSPEHTLMARAALMALAVYIIQHTLLPSGTFKETMGDETLEIMFVPIYLQAHLLLKALFCGVYVFFYNQEWVRVCVCTCINVMLLCLNHFMKPCSVGWINVLREMFFVHATLSGIQSVNYLVWPPNLSTKSMLVSTLASNCVCVTVAVFVFFKYSKRSTEYSITRSFLDLEWQVSRGGSVHPRVLEPLISLTLSPNKEDWKIAKKYIGQLVWLISYPNIRVQFQSAWGLANLAMLDTDVAAGEEDYRQMIHDAGGTRELFEWYTEMDFVVQLEALAAMTNLTLSDTVAEEMVTKHKCIPFFMSLVASNKLKHSQFAAIALGNIARKEFARELMRKCGGLQTLVGCVMSHDYQKRRYGCMALANMALSVSEDIVQVFASRGLLDRIVKMCERREVEMQKEVVTLIRNLSCHGKLRPLLLERGVVPAINTCLSSAVHEEVQEMCEEILLVLDSSQQGFAGSLNLKSLQKREVDKRITSGDTDLDTLRKTKPMEGRVEWSTWGSKLEAIFMSVLSVPTVNGSSLTTTIGVPVTANLSAGMPSAMLEKLTASKHVNSGFLQSDAVMQFVVLDRPVHGKLSKYLTTEPNIVYTPAKGYSGSDFFTFRLRVGHTNSAPATVAIMILSHADHIEAEASAHTQTAASSSSSNGNSNSNGAVQGNGKFSRMAASANSNNHNNNSSSAVSSPVNLNKGSLPRPYGTLGHSRSTSAIASSPSFLSTTGSNSPTTMASPSGGNLTTASGKQRSPFNLDAQQAVLPAADSETKDGTAGSNMKPRRPSVIDTILSRPNNNMTRPTNGIPGAPADSSPTPSRTNMSARGNTNARK